MAAICLITSCSDDRHILRMPLIVYVLIWIGFNGLSYLFAANRSSALIEIFLILNALFFFYLAVNRMRWCENIDYLLRLWGYVVVPLGLMSLYLRFFADYYDPYGISSFMYNANVLAAYMLFWIPYWTGKLYESFRNKDTIGIALSGLCTVLSFSAFILSRSYFGFLALGTAVFIVYAPAFRHTKMYLFFVKSGFRGKIFILCAAIITSVFVLNLHENPLKSILRRLMWWNVSIQMIHQHPLVGVGPGGFRESFLYFKNVNDRYNTLKNSSVLEKKNGRKDLGNTAYTHNIILQLASETGIPGMMLFVFIIAMIMTHFLKGYWSSNQDPQLKKILLVGIISFLIKQLVDFDFFFTSTNMIFWIWLGLVFSISREERSEEIDFSWITGIWKIVIIIVFLIVIPSVIKPFIYGQFVSRAEKALSSGDLNNTYKFLRKAECLKPAYPDHFYVYSLFYYNIFKETGNISYFEQAIGSIKKAVFYSKYNIIYRDILAKLEKKYSLIKKGHRS